MTFESKIEFLRNLGCDEVNHANQTLLEHLIGVYKLLKSWNVPEYIQDAGLFHSVYGTSYFKPVISSNFSISRSGNVLITYFGLCLISPPTMLS